MESQTGVLVTATFKGMNGSCGFLENKEYQLVIKQRQNNFILISKPDGSMFVPYQSLKAFFNNWTNVKGL